MGKAETEKKIRKAVEHAVPDVKDEILRRVETETDKVVPMNLRKKRRRKKRWENYLPMVTAAAILMLVINIGMGMHEKAEMNRVNTVIDLDVNPSVELCINSQDRVISATGINAEATAILGDMDLTGARTNVAVNAILGAMYANGYIDEHSNSILLSVDNEDEEESRLIQDKLVEDIDEILRGYEVEAAILSQTVEADENLQQWVDTYQISAGRASLIQKIIEINPNYTMEDLAYLTINELNLLISAQTIQVESVQTTGQASEAAYIGQEEALLIAMTDAGLQLEQVENLVTDIDILNARMVYGVAYVLDGMQYNYEIDALNGEIALYDVKEYVPEEEPEDTEPTEDSSSEEEPNQEPEDEEEEANVSGNSVSGNSVSDNSVSGNSVSGNSVSGNSVSGNSVSGNSVSGNSVSGNSASENSVSENQVSEEDSEDNDSEEDEENNEH